MNVMSFYERKRYQVNTSKSRLKEKISTAKWHVSLGINEVKKYTYFIYIGMKQCYASFQMEAYHSEATQVTLCHGGRCNKNYWLVLNKFKLNVVCPGSVLRLTSPVSVSFMTYRCNMDVAHKQKKRMIW